MQANHEVAVEIYRVLDERQEYMRYRVAINGVKHMDFVDSVQIRYGIATDGTIVDGETHTLDYKRLLDGVDGRGASVTVPTEVAEWAVRVTATTITVDVDVHGNQLKDLDININFLFCAEACRVFVRSVAGEKSATMYMA